MVKSKKTSQTTEEAFQAIGVGTTLPTQSRTKPTNYCPSNGNNNNNNNDNNDNNNNNNKPKAKVVGK